LERLERLKGLGQGNRQSKGWAMTANCVGMNVALTLNWSTPETDALCTFANFPVGQHIGCISRSLLFFLRHCGC
jgi:hypothetical protein